ncbi:MAG: futalosine hydrolase [Desulfobulbaceae bacterium]|nr:MAG: futalosine hydrolase [Desulfobulbaceae bacterium]
MFLAVAATEMEMTPLYRMTTGMDIGFLTLVTGVGPVAAAMQLTRFLCQELGQVRGIINFGVAGAYVQTPGLQIAGLLDVCLAEREVAGDFGVSYGDDIDHLPEDLTGKLAFDLDRSLLLQSGLVLQRNGMSPHLGTFVTVNAVSGTRARGENLRQQWQGLCENMEGASIARVAEAFALPFLEVRSISNMVEERNPQNWRLAEACAVAADAASCLLRELEI